MTAEQQPAEGLLLRITLRAAALLLAAATVLMAIQVTLRFGFNRPQAWAEEVDRYLFVWSVYVGTIVAVIRGTHIRVTVVTERFGARGEAWSLMLGRIIDGVCAAFVAYWGFQLAWSNRATEFYTLTFMPGVIFYLSVPVCMAVIALYLATPGRRPIHHGPSPAGGL